MRRRPSSLRASLALAVVTTVLTVLLGSLVTSARTSSPVSSTADLAAAATGDRADATSRDQSRPTLPTSPSTTSPTGSAGAAGTTAAPGGLPSYAVQASGEVLEPLATTLPPYEVKQAPVLRKLPPGPVPGTPFTFQVGTLNILGSQHARNGVGRASALAGAILGRGVDLVGMQEVQDDQLATMSSRLSGYTVWPGQALGNQGVRLQIAFRDTVFELVDTGSTSTIFDYQRRPIPWVLLRERSTGGEFYVVDIHNSPGGQERDRDLATGTEIGLVNELRSSGKPVLLMGDTNEHTEFACRVSAATGMVASNGLTTAGGGCSTGVGPIKIDWILGAGGVDFSGHVVDYGAPIPASTDHAFVHASVTITPMISQAEALADATDLPGSDDPADAEASPSE